MQRFLHQLLGLLVLTAIYGAAEWAMARLGLPFPGSLAGLLLCAALIRLGILRLAWVEGAATLLLSHLALFYLPLLAALGQHWPLLRSSGLPLLGAVIVATGLVIMTTGLVAERMSLPGEEHAHVDHAG